MLLDSYPMLAALYAEGPAPDRAAQMMLYGQFVGSWTGRVIHHDLGGKNASCEVHFGWALEGRAIQDVWITPARDVRAMRGATGAENWYGTTLRVYDPRRDFWRIIWIDPAMQIIAQMKGHKVGDEIVQEYRIDGRLRGEWRFSEITDTSFHWTRRESPDDGETWKVVTEVFVQRMRQGGKEVNE